MDKITQSMKMLCHGILLAADKDNLQKTHARYDNWKQSLKPEGSDSTYQRKKFNLIQTTDRIHGP